MLKVATHLKKNAYKYTFTVMTILSIHSLVMLGIHGDLSWFGLFVIESAFLVITLQFWEDEHKKNVSDKTTQ